LSLFSCMVRGFTCLPPPVRKTRGLSVFFPAQRHRHIAAWYFAPSRSLGAVRPDYNRFVNDAQLDATLQIVERTGAHLSHVRVVPIIRKPRLRRRAATGFRSGDQGLHLLLPHGRRQYATRRARRSVGEDDLPPRIWSDGYRPPLRSAAPHVSSSARLLITSSACCFGLSVRDVDCDFRLMRRSIVEKNDSRENSGVICLRWIKKSHGGFRHRRNAVHHYQHSALRQVRSLFTSRIANTPSTLRVSARYELVIPLDATCGPGCSAGQSARAGCDLRHDAGHTPSRRGWYATIRSF